MSAVMGIRPVSRKGAPVSATVAGPVTQVRVVRAEWTKLRALRSTWWCGLSAVVLIVGLGAAIAGSGTAYHVSVGNSAANGVSVALLGLLFTQLVIGVVVIGLALGALLRKTAAGLSVFAAVFFVVPIVVGALPQNITGFAPYLPSNAGGALWGSPLDTAHALSPWTGFAVLCGYAVVLTGLTAWRLRRRDA